MLGTSLANPESLLFKRQFLLGPEFASISGWEHVRLFNTYCLSLDPRLPRAEAQYKDREIVCLGDIYDPVHVESGNTEILGNLIKSINDYSDFERAVYGLGGRWLIFLRVGSQIRVYPDPTGSRPIYYCNSSGLYLGGTPQIIAETLHLTKDLTLVSEFNKHGVPHWWPGSATPYKEIFHLVPNHYYDVISRQPKRFWPTENIPALATSDVAKIILGLIHEIILAASKRYLLYIAITGGFDSRSILSGARFKTRIPARYFTLEYPGIKDVDLAIPDRIAKHLGLDYEKVFYLEPSREFLEFFDHNSSGMISGQCRLNAMSYARYPENALFLEGSASPIGKAAYYKKCPHPESLSSGMLCDIARFPNNPVAMQEFERWLSEVPKDTNINLLDIFFWEQRMGGWSAIDFATQEMTRQVFSPFNCRKILELMLAVPVRDRQYPHRLHKVLCDLGLPELKSFGFNRRDESIFAKIFRKIRRRLPVRPRS